MTSLRAHLRSLPSITGEAPPFDTDAAPADPAELFTDWLGEATRRGVVEAHAATLSTVDADGQPDARVLVLKDVTADGAFEIATGDESAKGTQLASNPRCALTFHWVPLARSVRIRGIALRAPDAAAAQDFLARHPAAKALALLGRQSTVIAPDEDATLLLAEARSKVEQAPDVVSPHWSVWRIVPRSVEFWQGSPDRNHTRLRYERAGDGWTVGRLWP